MIKNPQVFTGDYLKVGDVVLVEPDSQTLKTSNYKKLFWNKAIVTRIAAGRDQKARTVFLDEILPSGKTRQITRPIQALYPLEVLPEEVLAHVRRPTSDTESAQTALTLNL